jgi:hypothetical protein
MFKKMTFFELNTPIFGIFCSFLRIFAHPAQYSFFFGRLWPIFLFLRSNSYFRLFVYESYSGLRLKVLAAAAAKPIFRDFSSQKQPQQPQRRPQQLAADRGTL